MHARSAANVDVRDVPALRSQNHLDELQQSSEAVKLHVDDRSIVVVVLQWKDTPEASGPSS